MNSLWQNLRFALRQLGRNPGFTLTVVLTLALAIGANTAIFSVVNALIVKRLPYPQPERMGTIFRHIEGGASYDGGHSINGHVWEQLRDNVPSLVSAVSSGSATGVNLQTEQHAEYVHAGRISAHYLDVLGIHPALGRNFSVNEDRPHGPNAVILSYHLWRNTFNEDPNLIGQTIRLKGDAYTVIGVLPAGATTPMNADLYTDIQPSPQGEGAGSNYDVITRLRNGATWQQADSELNRAWTGWAQELAQEYGPGAHVWFYSVPLQRGETATLRPQVLALMSAAGFILLIACANLAGVTLVRMSRRLPEIGTRLSLGASRWQILRQLWVENLILASLGGAAGVGFGFLALRALLSLLPKGFLPVASVPLDARVLAFTACASLLTSVLFGMLPALTASRVDLRSSMANRGATGQPVRLRQSLIAGEVALTVVLLAGSGLLIRTLIHLQTLPPGFNPVGVMTAKASLDDARYHDPVAFRKLLEESTAAMEKIPGVQSAAVALSLPYERFVNDRVTFNDGPMVGQNSGADMDYVTPAYFQTLGMPLMAGRFFTDADGPNTQRVVIVNRTFAQKFFPGLSPIGHVIDKGVVIVGVVADIPLASGLNRTAPLQTEETMYIPAAQMDQPTSLAMLHTWFQPAWVVRTAAPIEGLTGQMQKALASVDPGLPFSGFYSMKDLLAKTLAMQRIEVALLGTMACLAMLLSAVGIFALVANLVTQRTREIGIRIALGSTIQQAMKHVSASGVRAAFIGLLLGLLMCAGVLRTMQSVLYGVRAFDLPSLLAVVATLAAVTLLAATIPALRIAKIDPATTLREE